MFYVPVLGWQAKPRGLTIYKQDTWCPPSLAAVVENITKNTTKNIIKKYRKILGSRVGHAYAEYANDADYAHMRNMRMRMRIENLIHIIHI